MEGIMKIAFLSDIHSNIVALEAVLQEIKGHHPEQIISLGDQINLGPCPRETLSLLRSENVTCLHGNHERYILSAMAGDPSVQGANFHSLRFNANLLKPEEITFPKELYLTEDVLCTHAMPDDDRFPVYDPALAYPKLKELSAQLDKPLHIFCGHGHNPTFYTLNKLTVHSIGSVGCMDQGAPGTAPYVIAEIENDGLSLRPYYVSYDTKKLIPLFLSSGMTEYCPIMSRIALTQMTYNCDMILDFVARASTLSKARGEQHISQQTWEDADRLYPWADGQSTAHFWQSYSR